jgi:hypothetical protein
VIATAASSPGVLAPTGATAIRAIRAPLLECPSHSPFDIPATTCPIAVATAPAAMFLARPSSKCATAAGKIQTELVSPQRAQAATAPGAAQQYVCDPRGMRTRTFSKRYSLKVLPIKLPAHRSPVGIVMLRNRTLGPVAHLFVQCAREVARSMDAE